MEQRRLTIVAQLNAVDVRELVREHLALVDEALFLLLQLPQPPHDREGLTEAGDEGDAPQQRAEYEEQIIGAGGWLVGEGNWCVSPDRKSAR